MASFTINGADGKMIRGDRTEGVGRQLLFITGFLSRRWGNKSRALAQWCEEQKWGFCCYDVRGFGDSDGAFADYVFSDWLADARTVISMLKDGPPLTLVGNSLGGWIAWLMAQESQEIERLILIAPAFNMMGVRARSISAERRQQWQGAGSMPWDDDPAHRDWPLSWRWVEESERYWQSSFDRLRPVRTTILHGLEDTVILPEGSREFVEHVLARDRNYPIVLDLIPGDHRLSNAEHSERLRRFVFDSAG
jgi:uncharacterized protein